MINQQTSETLMYSIESFEIKKTFFVWFTVSREETTSNYGCQNAVLRLYRGNARYPTMYVEAPEEKCGKLDGEPFLSNNDTFELE